MPKPTIGRIVHYWSLGDSEGKYPSEPHPAIITGVNPDGTVALHVFYKTGGFDMPSVVELQGEGALKGKWCWPPRE
ncbi:MAG: hypothetical protein KGR26_16105 [Cyanobacteria bacterium REEB65]|nr:hypothetical protein [Cyanobacteria bacterium REEB65]